MRQPSVSSESSRRVVQKSQTTSSRLPERRIAETTTSRSFFRSSTSTGCPLCTSGAACSSASIGGGGPSSSGAELKAVLLSLLKLSRHMPSTPLTASAGRLGCRCAGRGSIAPRSGLGAAEPTARPCFGEAARRGGSALTPSTPRLLGGLLLPSRPVGALVFGVPGFALLGVAGLPRAEQALLPRMAISALARTQKFGFGPGPDRAGR